MSEYQLISSMKYAGNKGTATYRLIKPAHPYIGFCGYLWQVIRAIHKYPNEKYYIYIGNPNGGENVWDFYFKQPHTDSHPSPSDIISEVGLLFDESSEFVDLYPCMQRLSKEEKDARKQQFGLITKSYFNLLPELQAELDLFKNTYFGGKQVLGFHFRGTDHPDSKDVANSFSEIDSLLDNYDLLFTTSDEAEVLNKLKSRYGKKLLSYDSTTRSNPCDFQMTRSPDTENTHAFRYNALVNWSKNNSGYKIGKDIIMETHLLASTNFLLCASNSNVNYFVRALNANLPYKIIYTPAL